MKKTLIILSLAIVILGVAYRLVKIMPGDVGTGETRVSPDKAYAATAYDWSSESFFGRKRRWFEFRIEDAQSGEVIQSLETDPIEGPYFGSRSDHRVVHWKADSTEVTFRFSSIDITMRIRPNEDPG